MRALQAERLLQAEHLDVGEFAWLASGAESSTGTRALESRLKSE